MKSIMKNKKHPTLYGQGHQDISTTDMPGFVCRESDGDLDRNGRCSESQGAKWAHNQSTN